MKRFAVFGVAVLLTVVMASTAAATKPVPGSGSYVVIGISPEGCPVLAVTGTLDGTATVCQRGQAGTDKAQFEGKVVLGGNEYFGTIVIGFSQTDRWAILGGTGELATLHGRGSAVDDLSATPPTGTYDGQFHFDP
ncbi:MAG: hypothetical protein PVG27_09215 [Chloroflexota bacterium]|jgi:hypothetical protein